MKYSTVQTVQWSPVSLVCGNYFQTAHTLVITISSTGNIDLVPRLCVSRTELLPFSTSVLIVT